MKEFAPLGWMAGAALGAAAARLIGAMARGPAPTRRKRWARRALLMFVVAAWVGLLFAAATLSRAQPAPAGTISIRWDPVPPPATAYRVYWGTASGAYDFSTTLLPTNGVVRNLDDCTEWFVAVTAISPAGAESPPSAEVVGWPRPRIDSVTPSAPLIAPGIYAVTIAGANYRPGAIVTTDAPGVNVQAVTVDGCLQVTAQLELTGAVETGSYAVSVVNPLGPVGHGTLDVTGAPAPDTPTNLHRVDDV